MAKPRILFAPAYSSEIGGGHLMRCLSLAAAIGGRAETVFAAPPAAAPIIERFATVPVQVVAPDEAVVADAVVVDDYAADAQTEGRLRRGARVLMAIDDLADRAHAAELLLDPGYRRRAADYRGLAPGGAELLIGAHYALVRPAFAQARARVAPVRRSVERVFVSFGLGDVDGVCGRAVAAMRPRLPGACLDVAIGSGAQSLAFLRTMAAQDERLALHVDATDVAELMLAADLGVGAGGSATWERCCLGLPSVTVAVADNQRPVVRALAHDGVVLAADLADADWETELVGNVERLCDPATRSALREASMAVCDGRGAERAADALLRRLADA